MNIATRQPAVTRPLMDRFQRHVSYLRISVTDRCDFRCVYCMAEEMAFLPKAELLSLEELDRIASAFIRRGVRKLRITGGEPLMRKGIMTLFENLSIHLQTGALAELTLTTNGSRLAEFAQPLARAGLRRVNVSLDTRDPARFTRLTRRGHLPDVLAGIAAAREAGLAVKINTVALKGENEDELEDLMRWAHAEGFDITFIETMPLGEVEGGRIGHYLPLSTVRAQLASRYTLVDLPDRTGGPARYVRVAETGGRLGFITPLTHNFCESCNRVRLTCTGMLYMCLGQDDSADLRAVLRSTDSDEALDAALDEAMLRKPKGHDFVITRKQDGPAVERHMSVTGG
jgi:cyclic pyranopterin phosphate synthase